MHANQIFNKLLRNIENSNLNYSISKTPFSATISFKCSLVKRYSEEKSEVINEEICLTDSDNQIIKQKNVEFEAEILKLREKVKSLEEATNVVKKQFVADKLKLQQAYDLEKNKSKVFEKENAEFREDLLKVKDEKHKMSLQLKTLKDDLKNKSGALEDSKDNVKNSEKMLKEKVDAKTVEVNHALKEVEKFKQLLVESETVKTSRLKDTVEIKSLYKCDKCDTNYQSYCQLRSHILRFHCKNTSSQNDLTSTFEEYECFYCDEKITSKDTLEVHVNICSDAAIGTEETNVMEYKVEAFPCDECGAKCISFDDLGRHITAYHHSLEILEENLVSESLWCGYCPLYFESKYDLEHHRSRCHWNQM